MVLNCRAVSTGLIGMESQQFAKDDVAYYWNANADAWTAEVRRGRDIYRERFNNPAFLSFIGDLKGKTVLDAGCGEGYNTRILARSGARMTGVDISPRMIHFAQEEEQRNPLGIRYETASFSNLSLLDDGYFDAVASFMALMDGPDYPSTVSEMFRVLRPGGNLSFSVTHPCFMTRGFGWVRDDNGRAVRLTVSDYFDTHPWLEHWGFSDPPQPEEAALFAVPAFPRTLSDYINTLVRAGFILKEIAEPRPPEEACRLHPSMQGWRYHAALFLYIRAEKPPAP